MTAPEMPPEVAATFAGFPDPVQSRLRDLRRLIFDVAAADKAIGPVVETLKWGEPAYLTQASKSGSTIRLGRVKSAPEDCALFFNCRTSLVEEFRAQFPDEFRVDKNRAVILRNDQPLPAEAVRICLGRALTYHLRRRAERSR